MATAKPLTKADHEKLVDQDGFSDWDYLPGEEGEPFEYKPSDWGRLKDGRLVALDYSTPAHLTKEELDELICAATWPDGAQGEQEKCGQLLPPEESPKLPVQDSLK